MWTVVDREVPAQVILIYRQSVPLPAFIWGPRLLSLQGQLESNILWMV